MSMAGDEYRDRVMAEERVANLERENIELRAQVKTVSANCDTYAGKCVYLEAKLAIADKCCSDLGEFCDSIGYTDELNEWMENEESENT